MNRINPKWPKPRHPFRHKIAHYLKLERGQTEYWYAPRYDKLMSGFRCDCGKLSDIHPCGGIDWAYGESETIEGDK